MAQGEMALVVGAGPGLGAALARRFAAAGMAVAMARRDIDRLKPLAEAVGARAFVCDATDPASVADWCAFEQAFLGQRGLPHAAGINHGLAHFQHLFSGDSYAAGYYVYLWAEVLDADAWDAFQEAGDAFDPAVAQRLRRCIYAVGNTVEPAEAFRAFRGRDPVIGPLLRQKGLVAA